MWYSTYTDLQDNTVFITGGDAGIGAACVDAFTRQGARVAFVSIADQAAQQLCETVETRTGAKPLFIHCDIRDVDCLQAAVARAEAELGPLGVLINNAARDDRHSLADFKPEQWDDSLNTNLRPHFFTAQAALPGMKRRGGGSIINVGSNASVLGLAGYSSYVTAKAGIVGLTKALARELGPDNVRVNALVPGWVMTERQKRLWATPAAVQECLRQQSLKTTISAEDVAQSALFLASRASAMITGHALIIDGGRA
ncbi:SDR family oxidoreductase [Exilibacterium tricleocarpae]|uniref:SDR family oxidoreductase n=1 Tax=Exilibacterium tricleocarpae TaxID=2591008 RepID=A0A545SY85_9GAMM|nr:SDR family oxidoreductase [Exilibacterium tricleocarpae]TQV69899.1 SDR family oxidoreductase [Exilibacterium tricleocarpae]